MGQINGLMDPLGIKQLLKKKTLVIPKEDTSFYQIPRPSIKANSEQSVYICLMRQN